MPETNGIIEKTLEILSSFGFSAPSGKAEGNLFTDIGMDSLTFVGFLIKLEEIFGIDFELLEFELCQELAVLIAAIHAKLKVKYD